MTHKLFQLSRLISHRIGHILDQIITNPQKEVELVHQTLINKHIILFACQTKSLKHWRTLHNRQQERRSTDPVGMYQKYGLYVQLVRTITVQIKPFWTLSIMELKHARLYLHSSVLTVIMRCDRALQLAYRMWSYTIGLVTILHGFWYVALGYCW